MPVSKIIFYKKAKQNKVETEYILAQRGKIISFLGREKKAGVVTNITRLSELIFLPRYFVEFLDLCVESKTSPRMVEELMWDYFSSRFCEKEKTDV